MRIFDRVGSAGLLFVATGWLLTQTHGHYSPSRLLWWLLAFLFFCWVRVSPRAAIRPRFDFSPELVLSVLWFLSSLWVLTDREFLLHPDRSHPLWSWMQPALFVQVALACVACVLAVVRVGARSIVFCAGLGIGLALVLRAVVPSVSPSPFIDVFTSNTAAAAHLLEGRNPYAQTYVDIYGGTYDYRPGFVYWPALLAWITPALKLFGDIRYGALIADIFTALLLAATARRMGLSRGTQWLSAAGWLSFPVSLFVFEQAWIDPMVLPGVALVAWALVSPRPDWKICALGTALALATKQYAVFVFAATAWVFYCRFGTAKMTRLVALSAGIVTLLIAPFLFSGFQGFIDQSIRMPLEQGLRRDSLSLTAIAWRLYPRFPYGLASAGLYFVTMVALAQWVRGRMKEDPSAQSTLLTWIDALVILHGVVFLFGKQAFCNYYYFLGWMAWLSVLAALASARASRA